MAIGLIHRLNIESGIKAIVNIQTNPSATISLIGSDKTTIFTALADSTTGLASVVVNKADTYTIGSDISTDSLAAGNDSTIDISDSKTYTAQFVKLNRGFTDAGCSNAYQSNSLLVWWNGTMPTEYFDAYYCVELDSDDNPISGTETQGDGTVYQLSTSISYRGFLKSVSSGTTKKYSVSTFITINDKKYYSESITVSGTAKIFSSTTKNYTSSTTVTVPEGCHSITVFCVGGGGGGGGYKYAEEKSGSYYYMYYGGCPGGGGGATTTKTVNGLTPGQTLKIVIGAGGARGYAWISSGNVQDGNGGTGGTTIVYLPSGISSRTAGGGSALTSIGAGGGTGGEGGSSKTATLSIPSAYNIKCGNGGTGTGRGGNGYYGTYCGKCEAGGIGAAYNGTYYGGGGMSGAGAYYYTKSSSSLKMETYFTDTSPYPPSNPSGGGGKGAYLTRTKSSTATTVSRSSAGTANSGGGGGGGSAYDKGSDKTLFNSCAGGSGFVSITFN